MAGLDINTQIFASIFICNKSAALIKQTTTLLIFVVKESVKMLTNMCGEEVITQTAPKAK